MTIRGSSFAAMAIPCSVVWLGWTALMAGGDLWHHFLTAWHMSITMAFGSFIAGATSEGGGAVAFPVMTLVFHVSPAVARDFALMIQTVGMNSAAFAIYFMRIPVEGRALLFASLGGVVGIVVGLERVHLPPAHAKMLFVSTWLAFAFALMWINRHRNRTVHDTIEDFGHRHAAMLFGTGVIGGVVSSITGSGIDICTFSLLVLRLRISEKVATPTSVILMAFNATVGFAYKSAFMPGGMAAEAWQYWYVCVPIVVLGAPFGAWFIKDKSRHLVAAILYASIALQFSWAIYVLQVYRNPSLAAFSAGVFVTGLALFRVLAKGGARRLRSLARARAAAPAPEAG